MTKEVSPWAVRGLYLLALIITVSPLFELVANLWPPRPLELLWRYGALGLSAGYMANVALGVALLMVMAYWQGHSKLLWIVGLASVVLSVLVLSAMTMFALDVGQVRALRVEEMQGATLVAGLMQEFKYLIGGLALACLGLGGMRMGGSGLHGERHEGSPGVLRGKHR
jgi:predicted lysophospholipase L1 biosynthesis ABC-type transport system permease subunit